MPFAETFTVGHIEKQRYASAELVHVLAARPTTARGPKDKLVLRNIDALGDFNHQSILQVPNLFSIYQMRHILQIICLCSFWP